MTGAIIEEKIQAMETQQTMLSFKARQIADELAAVRSNLAEHFGSALTPQNRREASNEFFMRQGGFSEEMRKVKDFYVAGQYDDHLIRVKLYSPHEVNDKKLLLYLHGGGWMQGNLETHDPLCRKIAKTLRTEVLAVDYRLAPEHAFPIPLEDVFSVYLWCCRNYGDRDIIIAGDSAGGNLCAALCIKLQEELRTTGCLIKKPSLQILFYPSLSNDFGKDSFRRFDVATLTKAGTAAYLAQYAGVAVEDVGSITDKLICPFLEDDPSVFPATAVISADYDVLLDEQTEFVQKLRSAGVKTEHIIADGTVHGFTIYGKVFSAETDAVLRQLAEKL
jgi:acetyl esterase